MSPAAFSGSYCDLKFIKSRSVAQVVVEIPIEQAAAFIAAFGAPEPSKECPVAIARLDMTKAASEAEKPRRKLSELPIAQRAALLCNRHAFRTFVKERYASGGRVGDDADAANMVRKYCGVISRSELSMNVLAATKFEALEREFNNWLMEPV